MDGATPYGGLTWDGGANFYGTAAQGGYTGTVCFSLFFSPADGCGTVFRLHRSGSNWTFSTLYEFRGGTVDGNFPTAAVTIAPDGSLYGTTWGGYFQGQRGCEGFGNNLHYGCGIVFNLRPPSTACKTALCFWTETISFAFPGTNDGGGAGPGLGALIFDRAGNLYGTNWNAQGNVGEVTQLVPSGGSLMLGWIYVSSDNGQSDTPNVIFNGLTFDAAENLYGTSLMGPDDGQYCRFGRYYNGCGTVYQLVSTSSGWTADKLYVFTDGDDGEFPMAGLVADQAGNLYGSTSAGGAGGGGVVFELSPSDGSWVYHSIYPLPGGNAQVACLIPVGGVGKCTGPWGNLLIDAAGNLYGASYANGTYELGNVFKLTRSNDTWAYTDLYDFTGGTDGANPIGSLTLDNNGNLYGTAIHGGANGDGVVFEIAQ
jgi:uncharacterized repeat protein (TIGR03803 family)